ncbi:MULTISPECIES: VanZ family protein [unclassified Streptomyces]|uniref:VanZ family protein n=1 Tax=unclassified Streptomyces TaxID=2593676 RepID=UPI003821FA2C
MQREGSNGESPAIRLRVTGGVLLVAHLVLVAWLTLRPLDVPWVAPANLHPFAGIRADLALGGPTAARRIAEGLALLAPLGVLIPLAHGRLQAPPLGSFVRTVAAGFLVSLAIALLQTGVPGRVPDIDAVLLNTVGVALAHAVVVPGGRARARRRGARERRGDAPKEGASQGRTPTIPRVGIVP